MNTAHPVEPTSFILLDPHVKEGHPKKLNIDLIAEKEYGMKYSSLTGARNEYDYPQNGSFITYLIDDWSDALHDMNYDDGHGPEIYLGRGDVIRGLNCIQFWLSGVASPEYVPQLRFVLADLIARDVLPRANYLYEYWW